MNKFIAWRSRSKMLFLFLLFCILFMLAGGCDKTEEMSNKAPICAILNPRNGDEHLQGEKIAIAIEATDTDGNVTEVMVKIDNIGVYTTNNFPYIYQWNTADVSSGIHTIIVTAKDNNNNEASSKIEILIIEESSIVLETGTVDDFDGNSYNTVKIGTQWWMAENLKTTHFSDGTEIMMVDNKQDWDNLDFSDKAYCYYDDSIFSANTYGTLYNWAAAMNGALSSEVTPSLVKGVCPDGWHLPSDPEWIVLEMELGMSHDEAWLVGWRGTNEGTKMKAKEGWNDFGNGTNSSGFSALPAGFRNSQGLFIDQGNTTNFWSTTEYINITTLAFNRQLNSNKSGVGWFRASHYYGYPKDFGFSVRCVKD